MLQFLGAGLLGAENLSTQRIDSGHDIANGTILSRTIHTLEDKQQGVAAGCLVQALQFGQ